MSHFNSSAGNYVEAFLKKRSFIGRWNVAKHSTKLFDYVIVIPAIAELENLERLLNSLAKNNRELFENFLILIVINNTARNANEIKEENLQTIKFLTQVIDSNGKDFNGLNLNFIDASTAGNELPVKTGGVGLARKLGCDAALTLLKPNNNGGIVWLDSDCLVSPNYFDEIRKFFTGGGRVGYFKFEHLLTNNPAINSAIVQYELFLHYYVMGLRHARSPFAFHTVGSTILVSPDVYVKNGGMNLKKAGEDFYFLEKLAKTTPVELVASAVVFPAARPSWRVPFGTGKTVQKFIESKRTQRFYAVESFEILKEWNEFFLRSSSLSADLYLKRANEISPELKEFLKTNNFTLWLEKVEKNVKDEKRLLKQKIFWFDGFRTLKLFHFLRERKIPDVEIQEALKAPWLFDSNAAEDGKDLNLLDFNDLLKALKLTRKLAFK